MEFSKRSPWHWPEHDKRLTRGLLFSLAVHGLLFSLSFGNDDFGVPGLAFPWQTRRSEVPQLHLATLPVVAGSPSLQEGSEPVVSEPPALPIFAHEVAPKESVATVLTVLAIGLLAEPAGDDEAMPEVVATTRTVAIAPSQARPTPITPQGDKTPAPAAKEDVMALMDTGKLGWAMPVAPAAAPVTPAAPFVPAAPFATAAPEESRDAPTPAIALEPAAPPGPGPATLKDQDSAEVARAAAASQEALRSAALRSETLGQAQVQAERMRLEVQRTQTARQEEVRAERTRLEAERQQAQLAAASRDQQAEAERARLEARQKEAVRQDALRQETARQDAARKDAAQKDSERKEAAQQDAVRQESLREQATREQAAREQAAKESARKDQAARELAAQDRAAKDQAARDQAGRDSASKEQVARDQAARQAPTTRGPVAAQREPTDEDKRDERLRAIGRQLDAEADRRRDAERAAVRQPPQASSLRRGRFFGRTEANEELALYAEAWSRKIQLNMTFAMVQDAVRQPHADPLVTVAVRSDGSVESVTFVRSSGVLALDDAIRRVVQSQANYAAFPAALLAEYDVVEIRRTWHFDMAIRLY